MRGIGSLVTSERHDVRRALGRGVRAQERRALDDDSDATILKYFDSSGNHDRDVAAFLCALAAALFFVWFLSALCTRLARAEGMAGVR